MVRLATLDSVGPGAPHAASGRPRRWVWALAALLALAPDARAGEPGFLVKYRSAANVYLDGGKARGLAIGDRLIVASNGATTAELEVVFIADESASCRVVSEKWPVRAGDTATLINKTAAAPEPEVEPEAADAEPEAAAATGAKRRARTGPWARVRGVFSLGYSRSWDETPAALDFEQRTARLDFSVWDIGGQPLTFNVRFRTRQDARARSLSAFTPRTQRDDRLYEMSFRYEPPSERVGFEAGRIGASHFSSVGYLDGALGRLRLGGPLQLGGFFGQRAEFDGSGAEVSGLKYGGFVRLAPAGRYAGGAYEMILAGVREFAGSEVSREYLSLESRFGSGRRFSAYERAELDVNRGWREDLAGRRYQLSNLAVSANLRFSAAGSFVLSYDNRKNYRTYQNRTIPQTIFDDFLQQGLRANLYVGRPSGLNLSLNSGVRFQEQQAENAYSYGGGMRHGSLFGSDVSLGFDYSGFQNRYTDGHLLTAQTGKHFGGGHYADLGYGHSLYRVIATGDRRKTEWLRLSGRAQLFRGFYCVGDFEYDRGDDIKGPRGLFELGYQF